MINNVSVCDAGPGLLYLSDPVTPLKPHAGPGNKWTQLLKIPGTIPSLTFINKWAIKTGTNGYLIFKKKSHRLGGEVISEFPTLTLGPGLGGAWQLRC